MQQQSKEYKGLIQSGVFFAPIIPQLGFLLFLIHLWLKRGDFVSCIKEDLSQKINLVIISSLFILMLGSVVFTIGPIGHSLEYLLYVLFIILGFYSIRVSNVIIPDLLKPFLYAISMFTIFGIFQWLFHIELVKQVGPLLVDIRFFEGDRINSLAGNPLVLAGLSTFAFLVGMILFLYYKSSMRYLFLVLAGVAFIDIILTQSRGNLLVSIVGISLLFLLDNKTRILIKVLILALIAVSFILFSQYQHNYGANSTSTIERFKNDKGSVNVRLALWKGSLELIKERPLLGYGPDSWQKAMKAKVGDKLGLGKEYGDVSDAHNTFLRLAVDFGIPFAVLFVAFILYKLISSYLVADKNIFNTGIATAILMIMLLGLIDNPISSINMTAIFIMFAGLFWRYEKNDVS